MATAIVTTWARQNWPVSSTASNRQINLAVYELAEWFLPEPNGKPAQATDLVPGDLREKLARYHGENVDCAFRGWNEVWLDQDFIDWNLEEFLPGVEIPLLVIQGESDEYGTQA